MTTEAAWFLNGVVLTATVALAFPMLRAAWGEWTLKIRVSMAVAAVAVFTTLWFN